MTLAATTYVAPPKLVATPHPPPGQAREMWSPTSATLVYGDRDAVLVDALMTADEGRALADWVAAGSAGRPQSTGTNVFVLAPDGKIELVTGLWR